MRKKNYIKMSQSEDTVEFSKKKKGNDKEKRKGRKKEGRRKSQWFHPLIIKAIEFNVSSI